MGSGEDTAEIRAFDNAILLHSVKAIYVLYPQELKRLLMNDEELLCKSLQRGKSELRYRANERRNGSEQR